MGNELTAAETVALGKVVSSDAVKKASSGLATGEHGVDFVVKVSGTLKKGNDYDQRIVAKADPWTLLAASLSHLNGVTVESLVREALTADPELVKSLKKNAADALGKLKAPTTTKCNGKVTTNVVASKT